MRPASETNTQEHTLGVGERERREPQNIETQSLRILDFIVMEYNLLPKIIGGGLLKGSFQGQRDGLVSKTVSRPAVRP